MLNTVTELCVEKEKNSFNFTYWHQGVDFRMRVISTSEAIGIEPPNGDISVSFILTLRFGNKLALHDHKNMFYDQTHFELSVKNILQNMFNLIFSHQWKS